MVKVRFAPSPTGIPHVGNTKAALYNFLFARANGGEFILRIEDTDRKRVVAGAEKAILEILEWLGLHYDGKPIHQSERLEIYKKYVQELVDKKIAHKKEGAIWIKIPEDKTFEWIDKIGNKTIKFLGKDVDEFVILKSDGFPTYHLANVVDDHLMGITDVIRGEEWISSTPKHLYLYESFSWPVPNFAHMPVILGPDKTKLSKRHGAKSVLDYRNEGFVKEALLNFMALLGWNPGGDQEKMDLNFMVKNFKLEDVNAASPIFDIKKLEWMNGVWIRTLAEKNELKERLADFYKDDEKIQAKLNDKGAEILITAAASRMKTLVDFQNIISIVRQRKMTKEEKEIAVKIHDFLMQELGEENWENEKFLAALKNFSKTENVPFKLIYFLLTGKEQSIGLLELNQIYGREFFIKNLKS
ncbi:MAG: glutamate--tRNA ligase family protein [Candidatus Levyibacteriota bacterium]